MVLTIQERLKDLCGAWADAGKACEAEATAPLTQISST